MPEKLTPEHPDAFPDSCTKLWIKYKSGKTVTHWSRDRSGGPKSPVRPELGLKRLQEHVERNIDNMEQAIIYDKRITKKRIVRHWVEGKLIVNEVL